MEKRTPHVPLARVKELVQAGRYEVRISAAQGAAALGLEVEDVIDVVMALSNIDFYKSMTTYADHRVWQDVYKPMTYVG
jgi:motility quorum-sensing regulator/GCU-specific mRNA interferase toxin